MAQLNSKIRLYLQENGKDYDDEFRNYYLEDNSSGVTELISWNVSGLAQPTAEQLNSYNDDATTFENNAVIRSTRRNAYGNIGDQLDLLYKDMLADKGDKSGEWFKAIKAVKDANPKE